MYLSNVVLDLGCMWTKERNKNVFEINKNIWNLIFFFINNEIKSHYNSAIIKKVFESEKNET